MASRIDRVHLSRIAELSHAVTGFLIALDIHGPKSAKAQAARDILRDKNGAAIQLALAEAGGDGWTIVQ